MGGNKDVKNSIGAAKLEWGEGERGENKLPHQGQGRGTRRSFQRLEDPCAQR